VVKGLMSKKVEEMSHEELRFMVWQEGFEGLRRQADGEREQDRRFITEVRQEVFSMDA
jgi:hypothetical protein